MFGRAYFGARYFGPRYFGGGSDVVASEDIIGAAGISNYHGLARDYRDRYLKKKREEEEEAEKLAELQREAERLAKLQLESERAVKETRQEKKKRKKFPSKETAKEPDFSAEIALARRRIEQQIAAIDEAEWQRDVAEIAYLLEIARQEEMREIEAQQMRDEEEAIILLLM